MTTKGRVLLEVFVALTMFMLRATNLANAESAKERCADKFCFPTSRTVDQVYLPLMGVGVKSYLIFDVYEAALYGLPGDATPEGILEDVPKLLVLKYRRTIEPQIMIEAADELLKANTSVNRTALKESIDQLHSAYEIVQDGDSYELSYLPGRGTVLSKNGVEKARIPGYDFSRAYFGIWLSRYPLNEKLRDRLLSGL